MVQVRQLCYISQWMWSLHRCIWLSVLEQHECMICTTVITLKSYVLDLMERANLRRSISSRRSLFSRWRCLTSFLSLSISVGGWTAHHKPTKLYLVYRKPHTPCWHHLYTLLNYAYLSPSVLSPGQKADRLIQSTHRYGISCSVVFLEIWSWRG